MARVVEGRGGGGGGAAAVLGDAKLAHKPKNQRASWHISYLPSRERACQRFSGFLANQGRWATKQRHLLPRLSDVRSCTPDAGATVETSDKMLRPDAGAAGEISDEMLTGACAEPEVGAMLAGAGALEPELGALKTVNMLCSDVP